MKKLFLVLVLLFVAGCCAFALPSDLRLRAMGNANASDSGDNSVVFFNPASLYFHNTDDFLNVHVSLSDYHESGQGRKAPFLPGGDFHARFAGKFLSFTGSIMTQSSRHDQHYDSLRTFSADISATAGWNDFISAGIGLNAGLSAEREGFVVHDNSRLTDFVLNMVAGEYKRVDDSEYAVVRTGVQVSYGGFRFGVLAPFVYTYSEGNGNFSYGGLSAGISYRGSKYHGRARLNSFVVSALAEIHNLLEEAKTLHLGAELTVNISSSNDFSIRAGYEGMLSDLKSGSLTFGACAGMGKFEINGFIEMDLNRHTNLEYSLEFVFYY